MKYLTFVLFTKIAFVCTEEKKKKEPLKTSSVLTIQGYYFKRTKYKLQLVYEKCLYLRHIFVDIVNLLPEAFKSV